MPAKRRIAAYLSHSYRAEDRAVNEFFWELLWEAGFSASIDRQTGIFSTAHVEMLMRRAPCYIAIVPERAGQSFYRTSPFMVYEHGLAVRAESKRLVFAEEGVSARPFRDKSLVITFSRAHLQENRATYLRELRRLYATCEPSASQEPRLLGKVGVYLQDSSEQVRELVNSHGFEAVDLQPNPLLVDMAALLTELDFVVCEVGPTAGTHWLYPFLLGKFVPTIATFRLGPADESVEMPILVSANIMPGMPISDGATVAWRSTDDLIAGLDPHLTRLRVGRLDHFSSYDSGLTYFRSRGRGAKKVFVSNFNDANEFAGKLCAQLDREGIDYFHYKYHPMSPGVDWQSTLLGEIEQTDLFVSLVTDGYWESEWAKREFESATSLARSGALDVVPYFLQGRPENVNLREQGRDLRGLPEAEQLSKIVTDLDSLMTRSVSENTVGKAEEAHVPRQADVVILTVIPEEYKAVVRHLENPQRLTASNKRRNRHAWLIGQVASQYEKPFSVAVALIGEPGTTNASVAMKNTIDRFRPKYALLVGVAGGLLKDDEWVAPEGKRVLERGDVVVSSVVYGYEYGKLDVGGFEPRHDQTYYVDSSLLAAAQALPVQSDWYKKLLVPAPGTTHDYPNVIAAPVASGDKVIDDPSDPLFDAVRRSWPKLRAVEMEGAGAAAAIRDSVDSGRTVGFMMVRGISDLPAPAARRVSANQSAASQTLERDRWKAYAADSAATFATQLIARLWPMPPR